MDLLDIEKYKESAHVSFHFVHLSHLDPCFHSRSQKTTNPSSDDLVGKLRFYVGTIQRICLISGDFNSDNTLILTTIAVKQCMDIGAKPHVCGVF
jgi:hypothetical protein